MSYLLIKVKVFPQSYLNIIEKISCENDKLLIIVRVTATAEKNKANNAIVKLLSKYFKVNQSSFELIKGSTCKNKIFRVNNPDKKFLIKLHHLNNEQMVTV